MNNGMMGRSADSGTMNSGNMSDMMNMMGQMMETCNKMMQMAMDNSWKDPSGGKPPAAR